MCKRIRLWKFYLHITRNPICTCMQLHWIDFFICYLYINTLRLFHIVHKIFLSERPGSNRRPQPWQGCALPTELLSLIQDRVRILHLGRYISFFVFDFCLRGLLYFGYLLGSFVYNEKLTSIFYFKPGCDKPGLVRIIPLSSSTKPSHRYVLYE